MDEAATCKVSEAWLQAAQVEYEYCYEALIANNTWTEVEAPPGVPILRGKWVFKAKLGPRGEIIRYKARWVAKGFEQRPGRDFTDTYAPVAPVPSISENNLEDSTVMVNKVVTVSCLA